ncbi:hypothetical protein [Galbibacter orientalis]|uniref:hypothetical protein n=1 Tax=Galbibacter orientalis TaxID=453852 RepID=UPI00307FD299
MNIKITGKIIKIFLLGTFAMFILILIVDWNEFKKGYNEGISAHKTMNVTK